MHKLALIPILLLFFSCRQSNENKVEEVYTLGNINYKFPVSDEAKSDFSKGLLLLHSFEYEDGKEAFRAAQVADKKEVMAHWGEAMCNYKALWGLQDLPAGTEMMAK